VFDHENKMKYQSLSHLITLYYGSEWVIDIYVEEHIRRYIRKHSNPTTGHL